MSKNKDIWIKVIGITCLVLLIFAIVLLIKSPATNYEASIYLATPWVVWAIIILSFICGFGIVVHQVYTKGKLWGIGLLLIAFTSLICFSVHILRGYILLGGDITTHLAFVQNIISSGKIDAANHYPALHLFVVFLNKLTSISPIKLLLYIPVPFYILYMYSFYLMSRAIFKEKGNAILATSIGIFTPIWMSLFYTTPNGISICLIPLIMYTFIKFITTNNRRKFIYVLATIIILAFLPLLHPLTALFLIIALSVIFIYITVIKHIKNVSRIKISSCMFFLIIVVILSLWTFVRLESFSRSENVEFETANQTANITNHIISKVTFFDSVLSAIKLMEDNGYSFPPYLLKRYALPLLYLILTIMALPIIIRNRNHLLIGLCLSGFALLFTAFLFINTYYSGYMNRVQEYIIIMSPIFAGVTIYEILMKVKAEQSILSWNRLRLIILAMVLIACLTNSIFTAYGSRYILFPNDQITNSELECMKWFIENKKSDIPTLTLSYQAYRLKYLYLPYEEARMRLDIEDWPPIPSPPYHFGYDKYETLGESVDRDYYMILNQQDKILYTEIWPEMVGKRFTPEDFAKLEYDPSIEKVNSYDGVDIWYIHARKGTVR